ncbi:putative nucleotide-binding protein (sugar kinase/HSP70/actin superfamily) [Desulfitispora alkaliphila]|uniref:acyl-CoA dehydratase activase-related protein n=1 Tax=Desulfitispora alkaliphila TaxID=622674 RepID=UPI003D2197E6
MKVTFPHMGNLDIPLKALLEGIGLEVIVPPKISRKTLNIGVQNSPEYACLPLKINIGNFVEAKELGADTILMAGGVGPCRFGYYASVQKEILKDMGCNYEMVVLEPPDTHYSELIKKINHLKKSTSWWQLYKSLKLAWQKACAIDQIEQTVQEIRPLERERKADKIFKKSLHDLDLAKSKNDIVDITTTAQHDLRDIELKSNSRVPRIAIVGEIYTVLEPYVNHNLEQELGRLGAQVHRSLYLSQWINDHLFMGKLTVPGSIGNGHNVENSYIRSFVGGHGRETVSSTIQYAEHQFDGVIQLAPFTCMPEIVAHSIMPTVSANVGIPTMTIYLDEQSGEAGLKTRLEAFVDLVWRQKNKMGAESSSELLPGN